MIEPGSGRKGAIYEFDYTYAVLKDIPTHYIKGTERIDKQRSRTTGEWINKITTINDTILENAKLLKIEGNVKYVNKERKSGFIKGDDGNEYYFLHHFLIDTDTDKKINVSARVRFLPSQDGEDFYAHNIEIL